MNQLIIALGLLATNVAAHATFQELWVNGVDKAGSCVRLPPSNNPVTSVTSDDIRCNVNGETGVSGVCSVAAGDTVTVEMHQQPGDRDCSTEAIGGAHYGPVIIYMSKVADAKTADGSSEWFKVAEDGYDASNDTWGTELLNANCGKRTFTVPKDLAPGDYLVRAEVIALHVASSEGGAQFYVSCYQVAVTGSGSTTPTSTYDALFPGAYHADDPGILINIYNSISSYTIPGPTPVFTG
ncbi:MAG: hypothetical protein M1820_009923 [Bogoriella megaspora]|nr:MAG: hypothetical protein M1820_009923 [Bogoriella megaspora]